MPGMVRGVPSTPQKDLNASLSNLDNPLFLRWSIWNAKISSKLINRRFESKVPTFTINKFRGSQHHEFSKFLFLIIS